MVGKQFFTTSRNGVIQGLSVFFLYAKAIMIRTLGSIISTKEILVLCIAFV